jgi:hypothetical protein
MANTNKFNPPEASESEMLDRLKVRVSQTTDRMTKLGHAMRTLGMTEASESMYQMSVDLGRAMDEYDRRRRKELSDYFDASQKHIGGVLDALVKKDPAEQPEGCKSPYCEPPWCKSCDQAGER